LVSYTPDDWGIPKKGDVMGRRRTVQAAIAVAAVSVVAVFVVTAGASGRPPGKATAAAHKPAVIRTGGRELFKPNPNNPPNKEDVITLGWSPGTITVHSGQRLTLVDGDNFGDPHVFVISPKKDLPKAGSAPFKNPVVRVVAPEVLNDPSNPQKGFKALTANRGKPGLNTIGDALVLTHKGAKESAIVSAKPGTTLYFFCAVHFWMQGEIKVVK
jgi:hypothetical protein